MPDNLDNIIKKYFHGDTTGEEFIAGIKPLTVSAFLKQGANTKKKIPDYQRPYSWSLKEVNDFLLDLHKISKTEDDKGWFLGSIYTSKASSASSILNLLDGQQRITTIYLVAREIMNFQYYYDDTDNSDESSPIKQFDINQVDSISKQKYKKIVRNISESIYNDELPRFETESDANGFLEEYLKPRDFSDFNNYVEWFKGIKLITEAENEDRENFSQTKLTLSENIFSIRLFLVDLVKDVDNPYELITLMGESLLNKLFLIEIPLKEKKYSIEFFEGLNNRGKSLGLIDRLTFKSISYLNNNDEDNLTIDNYRSEWKSLYILISKSVNSQSFFSNHGDFYTNLFLALGKREFNPGRSGKTKEDLFVEYFENRFLNSTESHSLKENERLEDTMKSETLEKFFIQSKNIINFINALQNPNESKFYKLCESKINDESYDTRLKEKKRNQAKALLRLLNTLIPASKPSLYLIMNLIYLNDPTKKENVYTILQGLFNIIKITLWRGIIMEIDPNAIRSGFHKLNKYITKGYKDRQNNSQNFTNIWKELLKEDGKLNNSIFLEFISNKKVAVEKFPEFYKENHDLVSTNDNNKSTFLIYLFTYISKFENLTKYENKIYQQRSLEHIWPQDWKTNWNIINEKNVYTQYNYTNQMVFDYIKGLGFGEENSEFEFVKNITAALGNYENNNFITNDSYIFNLTHDQDEPSSSSLIQWIGNKVAIPGTTNSGLSNKSFVDKKRIINSFGDNHKVLPCWDECDDSLSPGSQNDWVYSEVVKRTFEIVNEILLKLFINKNSTWDS